MREGRRIRIRRSRLGGKGLDRQVSISAHYLATVPLPPLFVLPFFPWHPDASLSSSRRTITAYTCSWPGSLPIFPRPTGWI
jgi:hypothetical protein